MYYPLTIARIRLAIDAAYPGTIATPDTLMPATPAPPPYLLWMCEEIENMNVYSVDEALKAARWIGWVLAHIELHGLWTNDESRDYIRQDKSHNHDRPRL
jgi:hypothetical protein